MVGADGVVTLIASEITATITNAYGAWSDASGTENTGNTVY